MSLTSEQASKMGKKSSRKGVRNKSTEEVRQRFSLLLENNIDRLQQDLDSLEPHQRLKIILDLAKFVLPTLKSTELKASESNNFRAITINWEQ